MCEVLNEVYHKIYNESFDYNDFDKRIKLQKSVYLLENMGIHVGNYSFSWNKYGPYSLGLDSDAKRCSDKKIEKKVLFTDVAENGFKYIKKLLSQKTNYSSVQWIECIASIHYLKNVFRIVPNKLYDELVKRKPYLNNQEDFKNALAIVNTIE